MAVPHRDNVTGPASLRPDHHDQTAVELTRCDEPRLAVVEAVVNDSRRQPGKYFVSPGEIEAAMLKR